MCVCVCPARQDLPDSDPEDTAEELTAVVCLESDLQDGQWGTLWESESESDFIAKQVYTYKAFAGV